MNAEVVAAQVKLFTQELKMPGLRVHFEEIAREAYRVACPRAEIESRREHRLQDRLKQARFPHRKMGCWRPSRALDESFGRVCL